MGDVFLIICISLSCLGLVIFNITHWGISLLILSVCVYLIASLRGVKEAEQFNDQTKT